MLESPNSDLPDDVDALRALVLEGRQNLAARTAENQALRTQVLHHTALIDKLKLQLARLRRMQFGRSSEKLDQEIEQLELMIEELETPLPSTVAQVRSEPITPTPRRSLPEHLPRESIVHDPVDKCPDCGGGLRPAGEDVSEMLEYIPEHWKVIRHVRPKRACRTCDTLVQAAAPHRPIAGGLAGPGLLAHVLVSKYCDHLPLYRQSEIYARAGVELARSTLADWVGHCSALLTPLVEKISEHVLRAKKLHADDTPVSVLSPGLGKTQTGRIWTYVRDDRPAGNPDPAAVRFLFTPDRKGIHPKHHLDRFEGTLQADGYAGFHHLYAGGKIKEAACWAHVRRKFFDFHAATGSPIAEEALKRIASLYAVEADLRGQLPEVRIRERQARAGPLLDELKRWMSATLQTISAKSELAGAIRYALPRWAALVRYRDDGALEIDNNAAERALRTIALGRKNYLFFGSDAGGDRAANLYTLIGTAKLNGIDPEAYLRFVIERIAEHPANQLDALLPWNLKDQLAR